MGPPGAARIEIGAAFGSVLVTDEPFSEWLEVGVLPEQVTATACGEPSSVFLQLFDGGDATLASDALPVWSWQLAAFSDAGAFLEFPGMPVPLRVEATDLVFAPEPGAFGAGLAAAATLLLGARARRRRGPAR